MVSETQKFSGLGMDSMLKNVKYKKNIWSNQANLIFFFLFVSQSSLGYFTRSQYWHQIVKENVLDNLWKKKTSEQPNKMILTRSLSKNKLTCKNAVARIYGSCTLLIMGSCFDSIEHLWNFHKSSQNLAVLPNFNSPLADGTSKAPHFRHSHFPYHVFPTLGEELSEYDFFLIFYQHTVEFR